MKRRAAIAAALVAALCAAVCCASTTGIRVTASGEMEAASRGGVELHVDLSSGVFSACLAGGRRSCVGGGSWYGVRAGRLFSSEDGTLRVVDSGTGDGEDALGVFREWWLRWEAVPPEEVGVVAVLRTVFREYEGVGDQGEGGAVLFRQVLEDGLRECSVGDAYSDLSTFFPTFAVGSTFLETAGFLTWHGLWDLGTTGVGLQGYQGGVEGGVPLVLFDRDTGADAMVLSPASNFKVGTQTLLWNGTVLGCGLQGQLDSVPVGFQHDTLLVASPRGINATVSLWGDLMRKLHGKKRAPADADPVIQRLGYWTDNGAYYYYHTVQDEGPQEAAQPHYFESSASPPPAAQDYTQTLQELRDYHRKADIPVGYYQLDSWWYKKANVSIFGDGSGLVLWEPLREVFPMGLEALQRDVLQGVPTINHNRWFAAVNEYQERYPFVVEGAYSLPVEPGVQSLFEYIMRHHLDWGMAVYEQDWLVYQFLRMNITKTDVHAARNWLMGMGEAARNLGLTIQFCMPLPADFLQSLEMPAVTQIRCSDDYLYHDTSYTQWKIGRTAMLAWAVGLRPFKDNFWSTSSQPGNTYHKMEPNPELQAIVSVLSAGPVALSDKIGLTNRTIAMATCRKDGVLLKPDMPAIPIDATYLKGGPQGEVWSTHTYVWGHRWTYLFSADLQGSFSVVPSHLGLPPYPDASDPASSYYLFDTSHFARIVRFSAHEPFTLPSSPADPVTFRTPHSLYTIASELPDSGGWVLMGEPGKYVPVSAQRFAGVRGIGEGLGMRLLGAPGEVITVAVKTPREIRLVSCTVPSTQDWVTLTVSNEGETCAPVAS